jgi:fructokinase
VNESRLIVGIGELLWDLLPEGARLGGAPANFSVASARMGNHAVILSRVGRDEFGHKAIEELDRMPIDASQIEIDPVHETGQVDVRFEQGEPQYSIHEPAAWDFLELTDAWVQLAERADALCFGSLAQRCCESRQTIQTLAAQTKSGCVRIFDVNMRAPFYSGEILQESLELATVVKLNQTELPEVLNLLGLPMEEAGNRELQRVGAQRLLDEFPMLDLIAVTRGAGGSLLVRRNEWNDHPGYPVTVSDTVGTGDAFTAALVHFLLQGADLATLNRAGNRWGSWVATQTGAMPKLPESLQAELMTATSAK